MLLHGDCLERLRELPACSVDACVTDPPYGLSFMGKKWDYDVPGEDIWRECLRVLKPGGHLLAFAGTRTQHRMAVRIEDAGFEIRDMIAWVYGSGFPKSMDVSKAIDKCNGETGRLLKFTEWMRTTGLTARQVDKITGTNMGGHYLTAASQPAIPTPALWALLRSHCGDVPEWVDQLVQRIEAEREVVGVCSVPIGHSFAGETYQGEGRTGSKTASITAPATPEAQQWAGWGTALKPALEPITMARKPFSSTVAANVLEHGTGAINIDGCRVPGSYETRNRQNDGGNSMFGMGAGGGAFVPAEGRWPANLIHDGSDEVVGLFPESKGQQGAISGKEPSGKTNAVYGEYQQRNESEPRNDSGSAARFFYQAKCSKKDRGEGNTHPTVKPTDLMAYLCRLVTPPGGIVLDPFMGSGSTGKAAMLEGFRFIGIEREAEYLEIAKQRMQEPTQTQGTLL
jgi:DNA modification methylase